MHVLALAASVEGEGEGNGGFTCDAATLASNRQEKARINAFQKYLSLWVLLAMTIGILIGHFVPSIPAAFERATIAQVSIPIAILLWGLILPMMIQINFRNVLLAIQQPRPILLTSFLNYAVAPFTMFALALLFFRVIFHGYLGSEKADDYLVGAVLLGSAPCTAMVFVWTALMNGDGAYTVTQVAVNDLLLLVTYVPTVKLLAGTTSLQMPWETLLLSVALFVVVPLLVGVTFRLVMSRRERWLRWMNERLLPAMDGISMVFLLLMIVLIFMSQASTILGNLLDILCISVPLLLQTVLVWAIAVALAWWMRLPYSIGGPASLIACSNFFEMAVAVAVALYGSSSGAALATVVGVLIEVPIMLLLVWLNNRYYCRSSSGKADMIELKLSQS